MLKRAKIHKVILPIWLLIVVSILPGMSPSQTPTALPVKVISVEVEGNQKVLAKDILDKIETKSGDEYQKYKIRQDITNIYNLGYFSDVAVDETPVQDGIKITFVVKENPIIEDVLFTGNRSYKEKRLKSELNFKEGQIYREVILQDYLDKLKKFYKEKNFFVDIQGEMVKVNEEKVKLKFTITEDRKTKILKINFHGNKSLRSKELKKKIKSKNSWLFISYYFDPTTYEEDKEKIERAFKDIGYVEVQVTMEDPKPIPGKKGVELNFNVVEGPRYNVGDIQVTGNRLYTDGEVRKIVKSRTGTTYSQTGMENDATRLYEMYADEGYLFTDVKPQLSLDTAKRIVNVTHQIQETNRMYLGDVRIKGISSDQEDIILSGKDYVEVPLKTKEKIIRRELLLDKGDVLRRDEMKVSQQKLMNLQYFEAVNIQPQPTISEETADLELYLAEKKTATANFGLGYSTNKKGEIYVDLQETNLFGTGRTVGLKADLAQEGSEYSLSFSDPYFLDTRLGVGVNIYRDQLDQTLDSHQLYYDSYGSPQFGASTSHDYEEIQIGGGITFSYPIQRNLTATLGFVHKQIKLKASEGTYIIPEPLGPTNSVTNSFIPGIVYDSRDNILWPKKGVRYVANVEFANTLLGGNNEFVKFYGEGNWYKPFGEKYLAALRLRGGYIYPYGSSNDAPITDRFFLGGSNTLRGFDFRGVSPKIRYVDTKNNEVIDLRVGGDVMLNTNLELRRKITKHIGALVFLDSGSVWQKPGDFDLGDLRYSVGPGVTVDTPLGYFQLGVGFPMNAQSGDDKNRFYFTFGTTF